MIAADAGTIRDAPLSKAERDIGMAPRCQQEVVVAVVVAAPPLARGWAHQGLRRPPITAQPRIRAPSSAHAATPHTATQVALRRSAGTRPTPSGLTEQLSTYPPLLGCGSAFPDWTRWGNPSRSGLQRAVFRGRSAAPPAGWSDVPETMI